MHHHYGDIRARIEEPPRWWDEHAVPRWGPFTPDATANIYADEVALVTIACQNCHTQFDVAFSDDHSSRMLAEAMGRRQRSSLADQIRSGCLHYGDPPNIGCCAPGPTMNCDDLRVLRYWRRTAAREWERDPTLEILLPDGARSAGTPTEGE